MLPSKWLYLKLSTTLRSNSRAKFRLDAQEAKTQFRVCTESLNLNQFKNSRNCWASAILVPLRTESMSKAQFCLFPNSVVLGDRYLEAEYSLVWVVGSHPFVDFPAARPLTLATKSRNGILYRLYEIMVVKNRQVKYPWSNPQICPVTKVLQELSLVKFDEFTIQSSLHTKKESFSIINQFGDFQCHFCLDAGAPNLSRSIFAHVWFFTTKKCLWRVLLHINTSYK